MSRYTGQPAPKTHYQIVAALEAELKKLEARKAQILRKLDRLRAYETMKQSDTSPMGVEAMKRQALNELSGMEDRIGFLRRQLEGMGVKAR
mgnify:CR=1 FL=1